MLEFFNNRNKKKTTKNVLVRDRVIVFDTDQRTCEIIAVDEVNEERVLAGEKSIPLADLSLSLSKQGRVYVLNAPSKIVEATENLARVEQNTIIRQIASYSQRHDDEKGIDWMKYILIGGIIVVALFGGIGGQG